MNVKSSIHDPVYCYVVVDICDPRFYILEIRILVNLILGWDNLGLVNLGLDGFGKD